MLAKQAEMLLSFSGQVTTSSTYGFPLPKDARIYRIDCWDGLNLVSKTANVSASQGERISVYAAFNAGNFDVSVRINGVNTTLTATGLAASSTLMVTVHLKLLETTGAQI